MALDLPKLAPDRCPLLGGDEQRSIAEETLLLRRMTTLLCGDDPERAETYALLVSADAPRYEDLGSREQTLARMLFFALWPEGGKFTSYDAGFDLRDSVHPAAGQRASSGEGQSSIDR